MQRWAGGERELWSTPSPSPGGDTLEKGTDCGPTTARHEMAKKWGSVLLLCFMIRALSEYLYPIFYII